MTARNLKVTLHDPFASVTLETERYVASSGWDQPPRLFALVATKDLIEREPQLAERLTEADYIPEALTAIEQEGIPADAPVDELLGAIAWPESVTGCVLVLERLVVPTDAEAGLPTDPEAALAALAAHPDRADVRLAAAVARDGRTLCLLRQRAHDSDDQVGTGTNLAPDLVEALQATFN